MKKILIIGSNGQLGKSFDNIFCSEYYDKYYIDKYNCLKNKKNFYEIDLSKNLIEIYKLIVKIKPDYVIHTAAYTDVDKSEDEKFLCYKINFEATRYIVEACKVSFSYLIFFSTDYVVGIPHILRCDKYIPSGKQHLHSEFFIERNSIEKKENKYFLNQYLINFYAYSKIESEVYINRNMKQNSYCIIRTCGLYTHNSKNFVNNIINKYKEDKELWVVNDQIVSPTYIEDLTKKVLYEIINSFNGIPSLVHIVNSGYCSWYDFSKEIIKYIDPDNYEKNIYPIPTILYNQKAKRPNFSALTTKYENFKMRNYKEALQDFFKNY